MKISLEIARTLKTLDQATETLEETLSSAQDEHYRVQEIAADLVAQCPPSMIVDALGKTGLYKLRRLIERDITARAEVKRMIEAEATTTPPTKTERTRPIKQDNRRTATRKASNPPTLPEDWETVEA